ncbi:hypothetical protein AAFF_G00365120 [Aldrovandia affinis]|uniref:Uncharacterized protein n=1 Tax=Aldrovandia affinis TaxID=143900 RepID=A0AAD7VZC6_9TELE|nr:hypothetical protein AAFF_G00365120 [Aldrovandia affinis]
MAHLSTITPSCKAAKSAGTTADRRVISCTPSVGCGEWKTEILRHHTSGAGTVNWGNCKPWLWPSQHWEVAKAYMPRGLANVSGAEHCDAAALLNLLNFCDYFSFIDQRQVREVIRQRNELMHSCEMRLSSHWMEQYQRSLDQLLLHLRHVPEVVTVGQEIKEILSVDWSVCAGRDAVDGGKEAGLEAGHVSQVEAELLRERLQELLLSTETQEPPDLQGLQELQTLRDFLRNQRDLQQRFQTELQRIELLESQLQLAVGRDRGGGAAELTKISVDLFFTKKKSFFPNLVANYTLCLFRFTLPT